MGPLTATQALFDAPFPSYEQLDKHAEARELSLIAWAEVDESINYHGMKKMLACGMDSTVVRDFGERVHARGGLQAMQGVYYTFLFAVSKMCFDMGLTEEQFMYVKDEVIMPIDQIHWDGVGDWQA